MSDWKNLQYKDGKMRTSEGGGGGGSSTFAGLDDVSFDNLQNGQVPKYNSITGKWENANESGGGGITLPECVVRRSEYSGNIYNREYMKYIGIATGTTAFSMEVYYSAPFDHDGYILSWGGQSTRAAFAMNLRGIVCYGDDWNYSGLHNGIHHRVVTYDGNKTVKSYEDNVLIDTRTLGGVLNFSDSYVYWGAWFVNGNYTFLGNVYYAKYYNKVLSDEEISLLYANRKKSSLII